MTNEFNLEGMKVGFAICGSFCTFSKVRDQLRTLKDAGAEIIPIMSFSAYNIDTRFTTAKAFIEDVENICSKKIICSLNDAEPIGPHKLTDILVIAPCTGNTLGKLAGGLSDTPVTMAAKSHLRNGRPIVIALSTNDALGGSARNLGQLLNTKHYYFVPMRQDDTVNKPNSVVADFTKIISTIKEALNNKQIQPLLLG